MATIITRLYKDEAAANAVVADLKADPYHGQKSTIITGSDALDERIGAAGVGEDAAAAYKPLVEKGNALLVVEALLGQARPAIKIIDKHPSVEVELDNQNAYVATAYEKDMSKLVMRDHPYMMTPKGQSPVFHGTTRFGAFLMPLISKRKPVGMTVYQGTKHFGAFLVPLISKRKPVGKTVYQGTKRFGAFLMPLLSSRTPPDHAVFRGTKRFGDFLMPLISRRDGSYASD